MLSDHDRIARQQRDPAFLRLSRALGRLRSVLTVMSTGAHPDDEASGLLAALRFGYGMRVVVACATRGEGGQNAIGPERGGALGALRTREMEAAARVLDASIAWLGAGPDDPVHDFGFSKTAADTFARWGEARIMERLVGAFRAERPDIVIPTFLDVGGQHGHHRAMTRAALAAFRLSGDPACFPAQIAAGLKPWRAAKLYLPAWSGAGASYDDEEPPPPATLQVEPPRRDPATGAAFAQIGEWSRACHASQGMGVWREDGPSAWPLHLHARAHGPLAPSGTSATACPPISPRSPTSPALRRPSPMRSGRRRKRWKRPSRPFRTVPPSPPRPCAPPGPSRGPGTPRPGTRGWSIGWGESSASSTPWCSRRVASPPAPPPGRPELRQGARPPSRCSWMPSRRPPKRGS